MTFALAGNQNSGKTTLFNQLTGSNQHVGNWPGVTVERREGAVRRHGDMEVVDLPGIYSLSPYTLEEVVSRDFLTSGEADGIINIVDASNIERNLYLTLQLRELRKPMVIALNMMDEARAAGDEFDIAGLRRELGVPVVPISARNGEGIDALVEEARKAVRDKKIPPVTDICEGHLHEALHAISHLIQGKAESLGLPARFCATKLVEGDGPMAEKLGLNREELHVIEEIAELMEHNLDIERDAALADARYTYISRLVEGHIRKGPKRGSNSRSNKIDRVLTHKIWAIPCFAAFMLIIFWFTFGPVGSFLSDGFAWLLGLGVDAVDGLLESTGAAPWLRGLFVDGVLTGITSMLGFLPVIVILFFFLSVMEDTGYMSRAAFVMDRALCKFGLSGRAFFPMIMGFGCSVPAIMATRTMQNPRERRLTILITPFMSCAARIPIYSLFIAAFFKTHGALVMFGIYALGIVIALLCAYFLKDAKPFRSSKTPFVMELPPYRVPSAKTVARLLLDKAGDFVRRAFTVIFAATVVIWFLQSFDTSFHIVENNDASILAWLGNLIKPVFAPLGFGTWQASTALLTGLTAKEAVVSTMAVLYNTSEDLLPELLRGLFTPAAACGFMVFTLLYMPCAAAFATMKRELGKWRYALAAAGFQTGVAWIMGFLTFQVVRLFT